MATRQNSGRSEKPWAAPVGGLKAPAATTSAEVIFMFGSRNEVRRVQAAASTACAAAGTSALTLGLPATYVSAPNKMPSAIAATVLISDHLIMKKQIPRGTLRVLIRTDRRRWLPTKGPTLS